jgi:hypothetical protein
LRSRSVKRVAGLRSLRIFLRRIRWRRGSSMTRFAAAAAVSIFLSLCTPFSAPFLALAQTGQGATSESRKIAQNITCDGGSVRDGRCACPAGFNLMPDGDNAFDGTCVKTHAENCLGGELTVDGRCLCRGQAVMSGETYLLEYVRGKCVPKRCPVQTLLRGGKCVTTSAASPATGPEPAGTGRPAPPKGEASDEGERRHHCGRGMVRTRSGCVIAHRRYPRLYWGPGSLRYYYYRTYRYPAFSY